jgi:glycosyltransferase involved in cell wall biosynthesis
MRGLPLPDPADTEPPRTIVVPWASTYLVPELAADPERTRRLLALARHTSTTCGTIGFDTVPITSAETSSTGFPGFFANYLAAVRHFDRITTISQAAGTEYGGWRAMLAAVGLDGPDIRPILLPAHPPVLDEAAIARARERFVVAGMPMVLCVGTHEPRKNHLAILQAAEVLWREGVRFSLTFIGGHSWNNDRFRRRLRELQDEGRPVESASGISDDLLWGAYHVARCSVFPSLNEGFGLPAAESLAVGTPVITSAFGSMREIAADGGALLVDPRDDASLTDALRRLLTDDELDLKLRAEARDRPVRTWDHYAEDTWQYLVG